MEFFLFFVALIVAWAYFSNKENKKKKWETQFKTPTRRDTEKFIFHIYGKSEPIEDNVWYQQLSAKNKSFVKYNGTYDKDWKLIASDVPVAGISKFDRTESFVKLAQIPGSTFFLQKEPDNPVNKNAIKVMISAFLNGSPQVKQLGYLPDNIANELVGKDIDVRPQSAFLPPSNSNMNLGIKVKILGRSARYLKKYGH